jgi:hypothetical protein
MAFTIRYVSVAGSGAHDGTTEGNAFTWAEMVADMATPRTGHWYWTLKGDYGDIGATTFTAGTASAANVVAGYSAVIDDLGGVRDNAGFLVTTNMPEISITANWTMANYVTLMNLNIDGAISAYLIGDTAVDLWNLASCNILNSQNNASAGCAQGDNQITLTNCDTWCSGAAHAALVDFDIRCVVDRCRFRGTSSSSLLVMLTGQSEGCTYWGDGGSPTAIETSNLLTAGAGFISQISNNTFYSVGTCIETGNLAPTLPLLVSNNHATDSAKWIDSLYSGTANITAIESYNRLRDITTPRTGVESIAFGEITTDTGGAETDYVDAANGDFHLIAAAPGRSAGVNGQDIGAWQTTAAGGGTRNVII